MNKIAIAGHKVSLFAGEESRIKRRIDDILVVLKRDRSDLLIMSPASIGAGQWCVESAINNGILYKLYLPCRPEVFGQFWKEDQISMLSQQANNKFCRGMFVAGDRCTNETIRARNCAMIDDANMLIVFWLGRKMGETFDCIKYAIGQGRQVFNAYGDDVIMLEGSDIESKN